MSSMLDLEKCDGRQQQALSERVPRLDGRLLSDGSAFHVDAAGSRAHAPGIRSRLPANHPLSLRGVGIHAVFPRARRAAAAHPAGSGRVQLPGHVPHHPHLGVSAKRRTAPLRCELGGASADHAVESWPRHRQAEVRVKNSVRDLRGQLNWTQADLAEKLGVSRQTVNAIETEKYDPSLPLAFKIAKIFRKPVEEIFKA